MTKLPLVDRRLRFILHFYFVYGYINNCLEIIVSLIKSNEKSKSVCGGDRPFRRLYYERQTAGYARRRRFAGSADYGGDLRSGEKRNNRKTFKENPVVVCSLGDNSVTEGEVSEAFQFAALHQLPIIFLVQDNTLPCDELRKWES